MIDPSVEGYLQRIYCKRRAIEERGAKKSRASLPGISDGTGI
jgi:hypothetical protein